MTKEAAEQYLVHLGCQSQLSIDDAVKAYRISLALGDHLQAMHFEHVYSDLIYDLFLEITLNIGKQEYFDTFLRYSQEWDEALCCDYKYIYMAIMIKQKNEIDDYASLLEILNRKYHTVESLEKMGLLSKSIDELECMLKTELADYKIEITHAELSRIASFIGDIDLAKKILEEIPAHKAWLIDPVYANISRLTAEINTDEAVEIWNDIKDHSFIKPEKYRMAKNIYKEDPQLANKLIDSMDEACFYGLEAYVASQNRDEKAINALINGLDERLEEDVMNETTYDHVLVEVALSIVETWPLTAFGLIEKLHGPLKELLDVQQAVAESLFNHGDTEQAFEYFGKIEVDCYKVLALEEILARHDDVKTLQKLFSKVMNFEYVPWKYEAMHLLQKKMTIPFEVLYDTVSQIMPYEHINYDSEAMHEYYEGYLIF